MITMKLGKGFWQSVERGYKHEQERLRKRGYMWLGQLGDNGQGEPLRARVRALYFDSNPLIDRIYLGAPDGIDLAKHYWQLLQEHILGVGVADLWNQMSSDENKRWLGEENRRCLVGALRAGNIIGRMLRQAGAKECLEVAVTNNYQVLSEGQFTKEVHSQDRKVDEEYLEAGTVMMSLWLLNRDSKPADQLWQSRLQNAGKTVAKTRCYRYCHCLAQLARLAMDKSAKQAVVAEQALLDIQLLWLKWLAKEPLIDIRMIDLVIAELIFQSCSTGVECSVQEALNNQRPEQARARYERLTQ